MIEGFVDRRFGDFIEHHAEDRFFIFAFAANLFGNMPANRFPFAVGVSRNENGFGFFRCRL